MEVLTRAANILDISEFEVINQAYMHWHGSTAPQRLIQATFSTYLKTQELPHWAKHYASHIVQSFEAELQKEGRLLKIFFMLFVTMPVRFKKTYRFFA
jgi:hypothetical protein